MKFPIQFKIVVLFSIIIFVGLSALLFVSYKVTEQNMYQIIHEDMIKAKTNLDIYLTQYFMIHKKRINLSSLASEKNMLSQELTTAIGGPVTIYNPNEAMYNHMKLPDDNDLEPSPSSQIVYKISVVDNKVIASLSFPIQQDHQIIGSLRYQKDYTDIYQKNSNFLSIIKMFAVSIFTFIFIASIFISNKITKPIRELTKHSESVALGDFNVDIQIPSRDEVGELARRFQIMIKHIKDQIAIIEQERDEVKLAQAQSKAFFDNVTHELKTPLTTILGYAQIVKDNGFTDAPFFEKGLKYIIHESQRLNRMVVDILELSQASASNIRYRLERVDLSEIVKEACEDMRIKSRKYNIRIQFGLEYGLYTLGDHDKLKEVFLNILDNSIKYGDVNSIIDVQSYAEGRLAVVRIKDKGNGIPTEHLEHVFEPFYRSSGMANREKGSAGLGLAIVKSIVEDHGGLIELHSTFKEGTEIKISLPGEWE
ncbi:HAMP domain-containing sensor histidine kinase [Paenibacillus peoriae]|uniref:sensor histidine kinase n=1 Tax=Paenibacillus peoriae TaxID=59893 RepID=UPI00026C62FB|nr:HAMP domain-containing sensor histidine kinase [Paenibacillus peoriae]MEC0180949.1 HAMP domain-containing sensor histidine kinase [Paenibacillus peoriae]